MPASHSLSPPLISVPLPVRTRRVIWATALGNGLVTYDFTVYGFSAVIIGTLFFPSSSALASLLLSLLTFAVGFMMRPIGALVIGNLADRKGRKLALMWSISLMMLGTGIIAFAPTYASIGAPAMLLIVLARLLQGFAAGGEIGVASVLLMELAPNARRCYLVSWRSASQAAAALAGALVGACTTAMLSPQALLDWGWRIPFVLGLLIGPVGWYLRRQLVELPPSTLRPSLKRLLAEHSRTLCLGVALMAAPTSGIYLMVYYMPTYLVRTLDMSPTLGLLSACISSASVFVALPLLARVADRQQQRKPTQYVTMIASMVLVYPMFLALTQGVGSSVSLLIIGSYCALLMGNNAVVAVMMMEALPRHHRGAGMSMIYSIGVTLFGGFCPFIVTWLMASTGNSMAPAWYLLAALGLSLYSLSRFPGRAPAC